jgi:uncharacterized membrane protein YraQ (UPF0718 family)
MKQAYKSLILLAVLLSLSVSIFAPKALADATDKSSCKNSSQTELNRCLKTNPIVTDLNKVLDFFSAVVGLVVIGNLIFAGIQYAYAGDNAAGVEKAKNRIINSLLALAAYFLIFGFVQWIVPGGLFG